MKAAVIGAFVLVMAKLVPAIHVFASAGPKDVDARHKAGHDDHLVSALVSHTRIGIST
jgi:hypothetical protein